MRLPKGETRRRSYGAADVDLTPVALLLALVIAHVKRGGYMSTALAQMAGLCVRNPSSHCVTTL